MGSTWSLLLLLILLAQFPIRFNGDNAGLAGLVPLDGALDFEVVAGVVGERVSADQKQNDVGGVELLVDGLGAIVAGENLMAAPAGDNALAFEQGEVIGELGLQGFVGGGLGDVEGNRLAWGDESLSDFVVVKPAVILDGGDREKKIYPTC